MSPPELPEIRPKLFDADILAEGVARVQRHLERVAARLPAEPAELRPETDATDAVLLHLWQAVQIVVDLGISACVRLGLGTPPSYAGPFAAWPTMVISTQPWQTASGAPPPFGTSSPPLMTRSTCGACTTRRCAAPPIY